MTQIGYVCKTCGSTILEEKIDLLIDSEIVSKNNEIEEHNTKARIEFKEQEIELEKISEQLYKLHKSRYPKYEFERSIHWCGLYNGTTWHVFEEDELFRFRGFIPYTQLYVSKTNEGKVSAYYSLCSNYQLKKEDRYVMCPLCSAKNYLPLKQLCLR